MKVRKTHELRNRILFTIFMLAVYIICKGILLYGISASGKSSSVTDAQSIMTMMLSGDSYQITVMALGIMPYINASLLVQIISALRSPNARAKISKQKSDRWMFIATIAFAVFMATIQSADLTYDSSSGPVRLVRFIAIIEMIAGSMLVYFLCRENERHGIGATMPIILVNIISSLVQNLDRYHFFRYTSLVVICIVVIVITLIMENILIKVQLQRVSIHNIHADQNYMAYKLNPVGIMPVMFATAAFMIPRYLFRFLAFLFPASSTIVAINDNMLITRPVGIGIYLIIIVILAVFFSFIMLNPRESARQLQKNGDSIVGIYAGKKTMRYLVNLVLKWSIISGCLQAACMSVSLIMSYYGDIPDMLAMIPSSTMIIVSIGCSTAQEIASYCRYDAYSFFL